MTNDIRCINLAITRLNEARKLVRLVQSPWFCSHITQENLPTLLEKIEKLDIKAIKEIVQNERRKTLNGMQLSDLRNLAQQYGITCVTNKRKDVLIREIGTAADIRAADKRTPINWDL